MKQRYQILKVTRTFKYRNFCRNDNKIVLKFLLIFNYVHILSLRTVVRSIKTFSELEITEFKESILYQLLSSMKGSDNPTLPFIYGSWVTVRTSQYVYKGNRSNIVLTKKFFYANRRTRFFGERLYIYMNLKSEFVSKS